MNPEMIRKEMKEKRNKSKEEINKNSSKSFKIITQLLMTILIMLGIMIGIKKSDKFRQEFYKHVFDTNFSFAQVNSIYQKYFGTPIPFSDFIKEPVQATFNEKLVYEKQEKYKEGVKLTVDKNYLVPIQDSGLVVFIGEKDGYGNTVIIQQMDGIDTWYGGLGTVHVKLYDYVEEGSLLGEVVDNSLYLVYKKEGTLLDYQEHI